MAQFEIHKNLQSKFPWELRADDDRVIARSPKAYETKRACQRSIATVKALASRPTDRHFEIHRDQQGRYQWRLRLRQDRVFAVSPQEGYATRGACREAIEEVRQLAPEAPVKDLTHPAPPPNLPPVASFTATPEGGEAPLRVLLDASASSDPDGSIVGYGWDFGDGETSEVQESPAAEHTYDTPDTYALTLTVTDDDGASDTVARIIEVSARVVLPAPSGLTAIPGDGQVVLTWEGVEGAASYNLYWSTSQDVSKQNGTRVEGVSSPYTHTGLANGTTYYYVVTAVDESGGESAESARVSAVPLAPNIAPTASFAFAPDAQNTLKVLFDASASSDPDGTIVSYEWEFGDGQSGSGVTAEHTYAEAGTYTVTLAVTDDDGASGSATRALSVVEEEVPPDPSTVAPPLDQTAATDLSSATSFLYEGEKPIQTGVEPESVVAERAAVLRGKVFNRDGSPLPAVKITVLDHPEFGQTLSRLDGMFDLAVNGGKQLTVCYEKEGYLQSHWQVDVPWQDFVRVPDAVMLKPDTEVTTVDLSSSQPPPPVRGSRIEDGNGARQATLLFPQGTSAKMHLSDGSTQELTTLNVRATEFTVGEKGPDAMPAELPPTSFYTYALELNADEAIEAGANEVEFDRPVPFYVENFLGFEVGTLVPVGSYDRQQGQWSSSENGRVIKITGIADGKADVDSVGDQQLPDGTPLPALEIDEAERRRLAELYETGQQLWRVPVKHFTKPWDANFPYGLPDDAQDPNQPPPVGNDREKENCESSGSTILTQSQVLGEDLPITGTAFSLHYGSDRVPGRKATLRIPLSGPQIPASLQSIELEVLVAGKMFTRSFPASPNQSTIFPWDDAGWDGKDAYGRTILGASPVTVRIGYTYHAVYRMVPFQGGYGSGGGSGGGSGAGAPPDFFFGSYGDRLTGVRARKELTIWQEWKGYIGTWDARASGLGGWSLDIHHAYDPTSQTLYLGDGGQRGTSARDIQTAITTIAGTGEVGFSGEDEPASTAQFRTPFAVAVGQDGSIYIADSGNHRVRRVAWDTERREWIIVTVAGTGVPGQGVEAPFGDGGPANEAKIFNPTGVALGSDGALYIGDSHGRIRRVEPNTQTGRVEPNGKISTVAGGGTPSDGWGDNGPAENAQLAGGPRVAVGPDDSIYVLDRGRVRRVRIITVPQDPSSGTPPKQIRVINTVAGGGNPPAGSIGDGGPATQALLDNPTGLTVGPDGTLYIAGGGRIRRVGPDGIINTVAGGGTPPVGSSNGDGGPPTEARLFGDAGAAVGPEGDLYIPEGLGGGAGHRIRRVALGIINTVAGTGVAGFSGENGPPAQAQLAGPSDVTVGPDHALYFADAANQRIRKVASVLPGFAPGDIFLPAEDGSEVYVFRGANGRHFRTLDALTGAVRYEFGYDDGGRLATVTDGDGNITRIERDAEGKPRAIIAPLGQRTELEVNAEGYLEQITNPAGEATRLAYHPGGLLASFTDPRRNAYTFEYDELGLLKLDKDPAGGLSSLTRTQSGRSYKVALLTAEGRESSYQVEHLSTGEERRVNQCCGGTQAVELIGTDQVDTVTAPDGTVTKLAPAPDPRWGMQTPVPKTRSLTTPGGLASTVVVDRKATLTDANDPFTLDTLVDTVSINDRTFTSTYSASARTITNKTPQGRQTVLTLDDHGRIVQVQVGSLLPVAFGYDDRGRPVAATRGTGPEARSISFAYNNEGYLETITDPLGRTISYGYNAAGRITKLISPDSQTLNYSYDANGNLVGLTPPGKPVHSFAYTVVDLLSEYNPPALGEEPTTTRYFFNADRLPSQITRAGGQTVDLGYDSAGRMSTLTLARGEVDYAYDTITGKLVMINAPGEIGLSYNYDGSLVTKEAWAGPIAGSVSYTYDNIFRVVSQSINGADVINLQYDDDDLLVKVGDLTLSRDPQNGLLTGTALGSLSDTWSYDGFGMPVSYSATHAGETVCTIQHTYNKAGRIVGKTETIGEATDTYNYVYDAVGCLLEVKKNGATIGTYTYDSNRNRLSHTGPGGTLTGTYDDQDRLSQYGSTTYTYTANGELLSKTQGSQTTNYQYDALGNLVAATLPNGTQIEYLIDGRNRRIGKKVNGTLIRGFLYEGQLNPIAELDNSGNIVSRFIYATKANVPAYMEKAGKAYYIVSDQLGSVRMVMDASTGDVAQRMDYDEFGQVTTDTNPGFQPFGFAGGIYDQDTKLIRFGTRDYDAEIGRWTAKDPSLFTTGDTNLYAYVGNQPTTLIDPTGNGPSFDNWYKKCLRLEERIQNIRKDIFKRMKEHQEDQFEQLEWCPGAARKETRSGHALIIRDLMERLWELEKQYGDDCGGPPPTPPLPSPFQEDRRAWQGWERGSISSDGVTEASGRAASTAATLITVAAIAAILLAPETGGASLLIFAL